jgi:hypothetical protein
MIIKKNVVEDTENKLSVSKKVSTNLSESLQLLNERFMACVKDVDTSDVEDVNFVNSLIRQFNDLVEVMSRSQNNTFKTLEEIKLTDEQGKPVTTYKLWVVGEFYLENEKPAYYKRRIVRARTPKEAVYKYKQVDASLDISLSCLGEKDNESDYSLNIENDEIID